jgi:hypothetical protein
VFDFYIATVANACSATPPWCAAGIGAQQMT